MKQLSALFVFAAVALGLPVSAQADTYQAWQIGQQCAVVLSQKSGWERTRAEADCKGRVLRLARFDRGDRDAEPSLHGESRQRCDPQRQQDLGASKGVAGSWRPVR